MKEIKFRAWTGKRMMTSGQTETAMSLRGWREDDDYILMQYTGLHDKNGKEIYEGDILLIPDDFQDIISWEIGGPWEPDNHLLAVVYQDGEWGVEAAYNGSLVVQKGFNGVGHLKSEMDFEKEVEIIGNIYENPELVK